MFDMPAISIYQWVGFSFGILYVLFAAYNKNQCWIYSAISAIAIACCLLYTSPSPRDRG